MKKTSFPLSLFAILGMAFITSCSSDLDLNEPVQLDKSIEVTEHSKNSQNNTFEFDGKQYDANVMVIQQRSSIFGDITSTISFGNTHSFYSTGATSLSELSLTTSEIGPNLNELSGTEITNFEHYRFLRDANIGFLQVFNGVSEITSSPGDQFETLRASDLSLKVREIDTNAKTIKVEFTVTRVDGEVLIGNYTGAYNLSAF
ncbi:hypothetical protein [Aquimarina rhabdastrellae]